MLVFDKRGNLEPYEPIGSDVNELKVCFVDGIPSKTRLENFEKYIKYSDALKAMLGGTVLKQLVNGSFVTRKLNPKDVDLVTFLDHEIIQQYGSRLNDFRADKSWLLYGVDAYIVEVHPETSSLYNQFTKSDIAEWYYLFRHTRLNRKGEKFTKGFIEIFY